MQQFDKRNIFQLESPKPTLFQNIQSQKNNTSSNPFQSSKELFYKTPNRQRMGSPTSNIPDLSGLISQKLSFFSNCIKNFVLSATKIQKILSQRAEDPETVFALKLFEEDKKQIERFLKQLEATKTGDFDFVYPESEKARTEMRFFPQDRPSGAEVSKANFLSPEARNQTEKMQYFETIDRMAKEKTKLRFTTQGHFFQQNAIMSKSPEPTMFSLPRAEIDSLQQENIELKKKIQEMISEKTQMVLQASSSGTSFHLGKTAITTNNTYFNEISQANLLKDFKKMEAKSEDRKKEIKRLFGLLKEKETELEQMRKNNKMNISDTLKYELNHVIQEFEGSLEKKYHDLEEELVNKQMQVDRLMAFISENGIEPRLSSNPNHDQRVNVHLDELEEKIAKIQEKLRKKEGISTQKKQEYEEMLRFLLAEKREFMTRNSDFLMKSRDKQPANTQARPPLIPERIKESSQVLPKKESRYSLQDDTARKIDASIQVDIPSGSPKDLETANRKLAEAIRAKEEAIKLRDDAIKSRDQVLKSVGDSSKIKEEALRTKEEALKSRDEAVRAKEENQKELAKANERLRNIEKNYQERIKQINKDNETIQERFKMVLKDLESEIVEKNKEIEDLHQKIGGSLTSQNEKSLIMKELENLTGKILDDFASIFKLLSINQQEFQHLDIECCFELLGKLLIQLLKEKNELFENIKVLKTRLHQAEISSSQDPKLLKELEFVTKKYQDDLNRLSQNSQSEKAQLLKSHEEERAKILDKINNLQKELLRNADENAKILSEMATLEQEFKSSEEEKSRILDELASFQREIKEFFASQEIGEQEFESQGPLSLLKLLIESYKKEVDKYQSVSQEYHREYEAKLNEIESKRLLSQEDQVDGEKPLKNDFLAKIAELKEEHRRELEALALEKDNEKEEYINVLNEAMKDLYVQIRMLGSEKKQIENDNLKLKMKLSSEIQSKEELQGKSAKKEVEFSQKYAELQGINAKVTNENVGLKTTNQDLTTKVARMSAEFTDLKKSFETTHLKNSQEITMYKDKLISLSNDLSDLQQNYDFLRDEFRIKLAEEKKNREQIEELEETIREKDRLLKEIMEKLNREEKINRENKENIEELNRKIRENSELEKKCKELEEKNKQKQGEIKEFEKKIQDFQIVISEKTDKIRELEGKSLILTQGTNEKEQELKDFLKRCEKDSQERTKEIEKLTNEKDAISKKFEETTRQNNDELKKKTDELSKNRSENEKLTKENSKFLESIEGLNRRLSEEEEKNKKLVKDIGEINKEKIRITEENQKNMVLLQEKGKSLKVLDDNFKEGQVNLRLTEEKCSLLERSLQVNEDKLKEKMRELQEKEVSISNLGERVKEKEQALKTLEEKKSDLEKKLMILDGKVKQLESELDEVKVSFECQEKTWLNKNDELISELEEKNREAQILTQQIDNLNEDKAKMVSEFEFKIKQIQSISNEKEQASTERERKNSLKLTELMDKLAKLNNENKELSAKYEEILSQKTMYELHLANQKDVIHDFESQNLQNINDLKEVLTSKDSELEEIRSQMFILKENNKAKENDFKKLEVQLKAKEKNLEDANRELKDIEDMNTKLKDQLLKNQEAVFNLEQAERGLQASEAEKETLMMEIEKLNSLLDEKHREIEDLQYELQEKDCLINQNSEKYEKALDEKERLLLEFSEKAVVDKTLFNQELAQLQQENLRLKDDLASQLESQPQAEIEALLQENQTLHALNKELAEKLVIQSPKEPVDFDNFNLFPDQGEQPSGLPENSMQDDPILLRSQLAALEESHKKLDFENKELKEKLALMQQQSKNEIPLESPEITEVKMEDFYANKHVEKTKKKGVADQVPAEMQTLMLENQELKDKITVLEGKLNSEPKAIGEDMFDNMESLVEKSMNEDTGILKEQIMLLEDQLRKTLQENKEVKGRLLFLEKRGSKAGFDEQMLDFLEDQNEKSNVNNDRSEIDYKLMEEQYKTLRLELEQQQKDSDLKVKALEVKLQEKEMEVIHLTQNVEALKEAKADLEKNVNENRGSLEKLTQIPKLENEIVLLKMKIENLTIKVSSLEKELQNAVKKLRLELEDLIGEPLEKELDFNDVFYEGFGKLKVLKAKFEDEYKNMKKETQEEGLKKQEKLFHLMEENQKLEKEKENLTKEFQKKLTKRDAESKQMILMSNVFEKLFNEILKHSDEIYKEDILELYELETKNKEYVDKIIEKVDAFLKKNKEKTEYLTGKIKQLEDSLANLTNKSKQLEVQNLEKENKLQEINQKLESMSHNHQNPNQKNSFSSIEADFSQLFQHKGNDLMENSSLSLKNEGAAPVEAMPKKEINRLMRFENEIEELKTLNEQLKNRNEQMSLELKEAATDEQKFLSQIALYKQELRNQEERYKVLENANIVESAKSHLIKFIENLAMKKNSEVETHLSILMSFLEIKDPEKASYIELLIPKDRKKSSSLFKK